MNPIKKYLRDRYNEKNRKRLANRQISLISSNCNGCVILHDLGLRFDSPFVNLWLFPKDFIKLCERLEYYLGLDIGFTEEEEIDYPIGVLDDIKIYFQHYSSNSDAEINWNKRKARINYDNLFIMFSERDGCTYEDLVNFDKLEFKNKVVFTHKEYPEIVSAVYIPGFEDQNEVGTLTSFKSKLSFKRYLDSFDYVRWFNNIRK